MAVLADKKKSENVKPPETHTLAALKDAFFTGTPERKLD
jgi:hypothetical protein